MKINEEEYLGSEKSKNLFVERREGVEVKRQRVTGKVYLDSVQHRHANSSPTVRLDEHRPATPETLRAAGPMFWVGAVRAPVILAFHRPPGKSVFALTFELGQGLLVASLRALLPVKLGDGVDRIEAEPVLVIGLRGHLVFLA